MKKLISSIMLALIALVAQAQILTPVKWKIKLDDKGGAPEKEIVFTATADKGWHLYDMNLPEGGPVSTSFTFETLNGAELIGQPVPSVKPTTVYDEQFAMNLRWYPGTVSFIQKLKVTDPAKFKVEGEVEFMACNDETCLPPDQIPFSFDKKSIHVDPALAANSSTTEVDKEDATTVQPDTQVVAEDASELNTPDPAAKETPATTSPKASDSLTDSPNLWSPVIDQLKAFGDSTVSAADTSWLFIFFAGFLGGLIALLTPCVWPMIPMTVSFFLKRTKDRKKAIRDAITYGLSIIVIYLVMGLLITGIFGASALNDLSTNAIFNILFFLLLVVFAVSFFGAFELVLPASWTSKLDSKADSTTGILSIFFMSFTLVLVSFSCTGPIIGFLLVQVSTTGSVVAPAIGMLGFAIALALPFTLFALFPSWLKSMPKSGGWMNVIKVTLGFLELAFALKFLSVADLAYGWRLLDRETFLALWIVIFALLGFYLLGKIRFAHDDELKHVSVTRLTLAIASLSFAVYMFPGMFGAPLKALSGYLPPMHTQDFVINTQGVVAAPSATAQTTEKIKYADILHWPYDLPGYFDLAQAEAAAREADKPLFVDITGISCVNCREMEARVWSDPRVQQILRDDYVLVALYTDDKTKVPENEWVTTAGGKVLKDIGRINSYIAQTRFGVNGQPNYLILGRDGQELVPKRAYNLDVEAYIDFLKSGVEAYNKTK